MGVIDRSAEGLGGGARMRAAKFLEGEEGKLVERWSRGSGSGILGGEREIGE
jgi:hypothetical protein